MKRVTIFGFFGLLMISAFLIGFMKYDEKEVEEFEKLRLSIAVDYAVDAAVEAVLDTGELGMDYGEEGKTTIDPKRALDTFTRVFLMNYNLSLSKENIAHVQNDFLPVFLVVTFDGYYMAQPRLVKSAADYPENSAVNQDWELTFGPKMPYKYVVGSSSYALNFGDYVIRMDGNTMTKQYTYPSGITNRADLYREISKIISTDVSYAVDKFNESNPNWSHTVYIPEGFTNITGVNPVRGPSVIAFVQGVDLATTKPIASFSIGGGKIQSRRTVSAYQRNGINYYCYSDQFVNITPQPDLIEVFATPKEAAEAGYAADVKYLQTGG